MPEEVPKTNEKPQNNANAPATLEASGSIKFVQSESPKAKFDVSLLDAAIFNLKIAREYIDEAENLIEHRLVSFHYGIALLARYRVPPNKEMLKIARQCLTDATNWQFGSEGHPEAQDDAHDRLVCEAFYNLGVIDELLGQHESAYSHFGMVFKIVEAKENHYSGVKTLASFGRISSGYKMLDIPAAERKEHLKITRKVISDEKEKLVGDIKELMKKRSGQAPSAAAFVSPARADKKEARQRRNPFSFFRRKQNEVVLESRQDEKTKTDVERVTANALLDLILRCLKSLEPSGS